MDAHGALQDNDFSAEPQNKANLQQVVVWDPTHVAHHTHSLSL